MVRSATLRYSPYGRKHIDLHVCFFREAIPELARHNREVVLAALEHYPPCLDKWEDIPEELRDDLEIAAEAVLCYMVKAKDVPALQDPNNLRTLIEEEKLGWKYLPQALVNNIDFVTSLARVSIFDASCMIESVNGLSYERSFWVMLTKKSTKYSDYRYCLCDVVQEAPNFVLADESIMMGLIQRDEKVLECVPPTLWECPSFVQSVLKTQGCALWYLPREEQLQHVDLIAEHFSVMDITECHLERGAESVLPQLWKEEKIASSWVRNGYPFVKNFHPETMTNDRELILLLARNTRWTNWFSTVPVELRSDKKFVKDVMKVNVTCFLDLPEALQKDFDLALTFVINGAESIIKEYIRKTDDNWRSLFMEPLKRRIKGMQREWDGWDEFEAAFFERGALNVGPEVTSALKRHVLAYVGYSHQQQLDRAFSALEEYENIDIIQCS